MTGKLSASAASAVGLAGLWAMTISEMPVTVISYLFS